MGAVRTLKVAVSGVVARVRVAIVLAITFAGVPAGSQAQTTYHLHNEASSTAGQGQLKTTAPDVAVVALQTANLKSTANGEKLVKAFDTQAGVPGVAGAIPTGATLTFQLWMKKTANVATMFPRAKVFLNNASGTALCTATGTTAITTTLANYTVSCTTTANVAVLAATRLYLWAGVNMTAGSTTTNFNAELDIEGTLNGNYDSQVAVPAILPPPTLSSPLSPTSGGIGQTVTVNGANFGASQGASTLRFNTTTSTPTSWSATSVTVPVPSGATTGNVTVTVAGQVSNGLAFTVLPTPTITSLAPTSGGIGVAVTINGTNFGASQGTSTVTFNGTAVTSITSWIATKIVTTVPAGATTGPVRVTVGGVPSAGTTFTVPVPPAITGVTPSNASAPTSVAITGSGFGATQGASTVRFNGTTATATAWSTSSITATIPSAATSGPLVVTVGGVASNNFSYTIPPAIASVSPDPAAPGATMTITGTNFGATKGTSTLLFNAVDSTTTSWSSTQIGAPVGAAGPVVVTVNGVPSNSKPFTLVPVAQLWNILPEIAAVGSTIRLDGVDFGLSQSTSTVTVNGAGATVASWTATRLDVVVPSGATATGNVVVRVGGVNTAAMPFTVTPRPQITSLSSSSAVVGTPITITGTGFRATSVFSGGASTITFNGVLATPLTWSDTSLTTSVPVGASTGPVVVTAGVDASNGIVLTVPQTPVIQTVVPAFGTPGSSVSVLGSDLGTTGTLKFNGVTATTSSWSPSAVVATVPATATTGPVTAVVGGAATNGVTFVVAGTTSVSGTITSQATGSGVSGAGIEARQFGQLRGSTTSSGTGAYSLSLTQGSYDLKVTASGFGAAFVPDVAVQPPGAALNVALSTSGSIAGTIRESSGSTPIPGATVMAMQGASIAATAIANTVGVYTLAGLGAGTYRVEVMAAGYVPRSDQVTLAAGAVAPHDVSLTGAGLTPIQYAYDERGRLMGVIDRAGDAATFTYDAVGNITAIDRRNASNLSIVGVTPSKAHVGASVLIAATGLAPLVSDNLVRFNGVTAAVTAATATTLTVAVPAGATTGPVTVTTPAGTASSAMSFVVLVGSQAPTIAGFSPTSGPGNTDVTITGANFTNIATTRVKFSDTVATTITAVSPTSISVAVPSGAMSGRVSVSTPSGTAISSGDFFVAFAGGFGFAGRTTVGGYIDVPLSDTLVSLVLFDGMVGQRVTFGVDFTGTVGACTMSLQGPENFSLSLSNTFCPTVSGPPHVVVLPATGTYTLRALLGSTGTARITIYNVPPDLSGSIAAGGTSISISTVPGQAAQYTFSGSLGTDLGVTLTGTTYANCWLYVNDPSLTNVISRACGVGNSFANLPPLLSTQPYTIIVQPWKTSAGSTTVALLAPVSQSLTVDGPPQTLATSVAGQSAQFSFAGTAGQRMGAWATADTFGDCQQFQLVRPDGTVQAAIAAGCAGGLFLGAETLASTGTYSLVREPNGLTTGTTTMQVVTVPADVLDTASVGGPPRTLTTAAAGQNAILSFDGTSGQTATIQASASTLGTSELTLRRPDGTQAGQWFLTGASGGFAVGPLSQTGTYTLTVDPRGGTVGSITLAVVTP